MKLIIFISIIISTVVNANQSTSILLGGTVKKEITVEIDHRKKTMIEVKSNFSSDELNLKKIYTKNKNIIVLSINKENKEYVALFEFCI